MACVRAGTSLTALFPSPSDSLLCCLSPARPPVRFPHALSSLPPPAHSPAPALSVADSLTSPSFAPDLLSLIRARFHLSPAFSSLSQPLEPSFSFSPTRIHVETRSAVCTTYTRAHVASHVHTAPKVFARGGQYSPTTRTTPSRPGWKRELGGHSTAKEIRFYPAAVAETFFPYLGITSKLE